MSKLKWNSKELISRDNLSSSGKSDQSQTSFNKFDSNSKNKNSVKKDMGTTIQRLRKKTMLLNSSQSKSNTSILRDLKTDRLHMDSIHVENTHKENRQKGLVKDKQKIGLLLKKTKKILEDVHILFDLMIKELDKFNNYMTTQYKLWKQSLFQSKHTLFSSSYVRKTESIVQNERPQEFNDKSHLNFTPNPKNTVQKEKSMFSALKHKILPNLHTYSNIPNQKQKPLQSQRTEKSSTLTSIARQNNFLSSRMENSSTSIRESSRSLEMKIKVNSAINRMKNVLGE